MSEFIFCEQHDEIKEKCHACLQEEIRSLRESLEAAKKSCEATGNEWHKTILKRREAEQALEAQKKRLEDAERGWEQAMITARNAHLELEAERLESASWKARADKSWANYDIERKAREEAEAKWYQSNKNLHDAWKRAEAAEKALSEKEQKIIHLEAMNRQCESRIGFLEGEARDSFRESTEASEREIAHVKAAGESSTVLLRERDEALVALEASREREAHWGKVLDQYCSHWDQCGARHGGGCDCGLELAFAPKPQEPR